MRRGSAELLLRSPAPPSQLDSLVAQDFGHVPEGLVELDIFINAFDGPAFGDVALVGSAARVVALAAADNVFVFNVVQRSFAPSPKRRGLRSTKGLTGALLRSSHR